MSSGSPPSDEHPPGRHRARKGRGALDNRSGRYESVAREAIDDGWSSQDRAPPLKTTLTLDASRKALSYNDSPDVPFDRAVNPYRGCEHGCVYCYARPSHAWLGLSPGLDFESRLLYRPHTPELLRSELGRRGYRCRPIGLGSNTDAYQPVERRLEITRDLLTVLLEHRHPVRIITKSALVERDIDLLAELASERLCTVHVSISTLDHALARRLEPRASAPQRRVRTIRTLAEAGVPVGVLVAPVIPVLTDHELETVMATAREAGAATARWSLIRLPQELGPLFVDWLHEHEPGKAEHVLARIRDARGGQLYRGGFETRMRGTGEYAMLLARRFTLAARRLRFEGAPALDCARFRVPAAAPGDSISAPTEAGGAMQLTLL